MTQCLKCSFCSDPPVASSRCSQEDVGESEIALKNPALGSVVDAAAQMMSLPSKSAQPAHATSEVTVTLAADNRKPCSTLSKSQSKGVAGKSMSSLQALIRTQETEQGGVVSSSTPTNLGDGARFFQLTSSSIGVKPESLNSGSPNLLCTTKFTPLTWLPKSLFHQFLRLANVYFAFIAIIVVIGSVGGNNWSPKKVESKVGPFLMVLLLTACKDLFEDMRRRRDDKKENNRLVQRLNLQERRFEAVKWCDVLVGDLLYIADEEAFPADLIALSVAQDHEMYISTVMLDGETNLKVKEVPGVLAVMAEEAKEVKVPAEWQQQAEFKAALASAYRLLECSNGTMELAVGVPTAVISEVSGKISGVGPEMKKGSVLEENFLPRGCVLRNTPYMLGVAAYVGEHTKTRMNATSAKLKFANMQHALNGSVRGLLLFVFGICLFMTCAAEFELLGPKSSSQPPYILYLMFCIAFYHAVPISLYVVYEMLKLVLAFKLNMDPQLADESGQGATARTSDLMEEMGQVDFVFSDKTGTLTANDMVFARCHVNGQDLGDFRVQPPSTGPTFSNAQKSPRRSFMGRRSQTKEEEVPTSAPSDEACREPQGLCEARKWLDGSMGESAREAMLWFFKCLGLCHNAQVEQLETGPKYACMSPDEIALCAAGQTVGVAFTERRRLAGRQCQVDLTLPDGTVETWDVVHEIPFSSFRKRMSVVVRKGDSIYIMTKGADAVMEPLLAEGLSKAAKSDLYDFAVAGLRGLVVASRHLSQEFFENWIAQYENILGALDAAARDRHIEELNSLLEIDMDFVGLTGVEDRLQDGVPAAIQKLKDAGCRVWVLTGDKTETAVNIARSCQLFADTTTLAYVTSKGGSEEAALQALNDAQRTFNGVDDAGLVIDGATLLTAMENTECRQRIFELGMSSRSCVCTRLSPKQKLEIVKLVRETDPSKITLAIGDGANDVPMILGAHVGIGIRGLEGASAVQACDVAISQFRFLVPLLLCHGRNAYRRIAIFLCYYFYKNIVLLMADLVWNLFDNFQARIAFPEYLSIAFNAFFTSWHVIFVLGFDRDVPDETAIDNPQLYHCGPRRELFNIKVFSTWLLCAVAHGCMCWLVPCLAVGGVEYTPKVPSIFWVGSCLAFTNVVIVALLKLVIEAENPFSKFTLAPTAVTFMLFVAYLWGIGYTPMGYSFQPNMKHIPERMFTESGVPVFLLVPFVIVIPDILWRILRSWLKQRRRPAAKPV
eukprot:TRINITY_DN22780_c0_g3_i1.p1 TRINITY_DN22780_c0_g3~~TRINITY_DN22780_c0_g3_i1.p1  ORF type:complete len:1234 (-),score=247.61 TRINITY_DN22780_c0_g3_i1:375-4076(-)